MRDRLIRRRLGVGASQVAERWRLATREDVARSWFSKTITTTCASGGTENAADDPSARLLADLDHAVALPTRPIAAAASSSSDERARDTQGSCDCRMTPALWPTRDLPFGRFYD